MLNWHYDEKKRNKVSTFTIKFIFKKTKDRSMHLRNNVTSDWILSKIWEQYVLLYIVGNSRGLSWGIKVTYFQNTVEH